MTQAKRRIRQRGSQLEELVLEILGAFFDLRAVGQEHGLVNQAGAGTWGLMRILREGPRTVPEIARMRSVSRQYVQKLANELIQEGLIETVENPAHKRSKLLRLTRAGERRFELLTGRFRSFLEELSGGFRVSDLRVSAETVRQLRKKLANTLPTQA